MIFSTISLPGKTNSSPVTIFAEIPFNKYKELYGKSTINTKFPIYPVDFLSDQNLLW